MKWLLASMAAGAAMAAAFGDGAAAAPVIVPAKIDAVFKKFGPSTPGCALGVYSAGKVLYAKGYGMANLDLDVPITPETVFDIGSTSKQFTAAAVVLLADEGKLSLDDDVRKYLPELPDYGRIITIDDLLHHTSGLRDYNGLLFLAGHHFEDFTTDEDALDIIARQKALNFETGTQWSYTNTGFFLLSIIVKRVSGQSLDAFAKERLFTPLGMPISHFRNDHTAIVKRRAVAYDRSGPNAFKINMSNWDQLGDGAVQTNVLELAKWDGEFYAPKVGGRALVDKLQTRATLRDGKPTPYGRGLFLDDYRGLARVRHGGAWAGFRATLMRFPTERLAIGMTCNLSDANPDKLAEAVADVVLAKALSASAADPAAAEKSPVTQSADVGPRLDLAALAGAYVSDGAQSAIRLTAEKGVLTLHVSGRAFTLTQTGPRRLTADRLPLTVDLDSDGQGLRLALYGAEEPPFRRMVAYAPTAAEIDALAGRYHSAELDADWSIQVEKGVAYLTSRTSGRMALTALSGDIWTSDDSFLAFRRDPAGQVSGFDLSVARMLRIGFERAAAGGGR